MVDWRHCRLCARRPHRNAWRRDKEACALPGTRWTRVVRRRSDLVPLEPRMPAALASVAAGFSGLGALAGTSAAASTLLGAAIYGGTYAATTYALSKAAAALSQKGK